MKTLAPLCRIAATRLSLVVLGVLVFASAATGSGVLYNQGDVFAGVGGGQIKHFSPTGVLLDTLDTLCGGGDTLGMAWDPAGNLYGTANFGCTPQVYKFDNTGVLIGPFGTGYTSAESVVIANDGDVFVGQPDGSRTIRKYDAAGNFLTEYTAATENRGTDFIVLDADQCTMFYTSEGSSVKRFDVCTNTQLADFATGLAAPLYQFRLLPAGGLLVANSSSVLQLDGAGLLIATYPPAPGEGLLFALDRDPDGVTFWTAGLSTGNVYRYNIGTPAQPITTFNAGIVGFEMAGLGVFGELIVGQPTPTPGGPLPTPTPRPAGTQTIIPTLSTTMLAILGIALALVAFVVLRRQ